jgi:hypothetical protein
MTVNALAWNDLITTATHIFNRGTAIPFHHGILFCKRPTIVTTRYR